MGFLAGKRALIVGLASNRSIAWGIAQAMHREGAELAFSYQNDKLKPRVEKMAAECGSELTMPCDVSSDEEIAGVFEYLGKHWDKIDIIIHSVGFAPKEELVGDYVEMTTREGFQIAHDISSYSFTALAKAARPMMQGTNGSLITLSYLGAERAMPNYNVMAQALGPEGIRVNCVSAGPIRTLAAAGIGDFRTMLKQVEDNAPLRKNVTIEEVGNTTAFLASDLASGITGQVVYVDSGYNIIGMPRLDA